MLIDCSSWGRYGRHLPALIPIRRGQLQLDVIWVADGHHVDAEAATQVLDLAAADALRVEVGRGCFQFRPAADAEADVVEAEAVLAEMFIDRDRRGCIRGQRHAEDEVPVGEQPARAHVNQRLEPEVPGVERLAAGQVRHGQCNVMNIPDSKCFHLVPP